MLRRLSEAGARLWGLYGLVEKRLGFSRLAEASVASNVAWSVPCSSACAAAMRAKALIERAGGRVCVVGPLAGGPPRGCGAVVVAGEDAVEAAAASRRPTPAILVTDADGAPPLDPHTAGFIVFMHIHADNLHSVSQRIPRAQRGSLLLTSQVPVHGCIVSPFGFADGDRAILAAAALGGAVVRVEGVDAEPASEKFKASMEYVKALARLLGYRLEVESRYSFTLKRLTLN
ncbi:hypothetical protein [Stetteria hydrogenophila]